MFEMSLINPRSRSISREGDFMKLILIALFAMSANVFAATQQLLTITNDIDSETAIFSVETDDRGDVVSFVNASFINGKPNNSTRFTADQAINGVVLTKKKG